VVVRLHLARLAASTTFATLTPFSIFRSIALEASVSLGEIVRLAIVAIPITILEGGIATAASIVSVTVSVSVAIAVSILFLSDSKRMSAAANTEFNFVFPNALYNHSIGIPRVVDNILALIHNSLCYLTISPS